MSKQMKRQAGFTLVELAVVMIIIGLLIGGVLKGQELIGNAQVTSTVAQVKGIDAATSTFRDMYSALPGDMPAAATRLPNCAGACVVAAADGNGTLNSPFTGAPTAEANAFFVQLSVADLVTGIDPGGVAGAWGTLFPETPIRGTGLTIGSSTTAAQLGGGTQSAGARSGLYLAITTNPAAAPAAAITPNQAARIDNKLDDGVPAGGSVRSNGGNCIAGAVYNEDDPDQVCYLVMRIQG